MLRAATFSRPMARTIDVTLRTPHFVSTHVLAFRAWGEVGHPHELTVRVLLDEVLSLDELVGESAELIVRAAEEPPRFVRGIVESVELEASPEEGNVRIKPCYVFHVVSRLALLSRSEDCRIFQELTVPEIICEVLADHGIDKEVDGVEQVALRLGASYPKREYCVQYRETALHFISRLCESEGIYFFSEFDEDSALERLVFADDSTTCKRAPAEPVPQRAGTGQHGEAKVVTRLERQDAVVSGHVTLRSYDWKRPDLLAQLTKTQEADRHTDLQVYDFSSDFVEEAEGARLASVRLEALQAGRLRFDVVTDVAEIGAGGGFAIESGFPPETAEYFVVSVEHEYQADLRLREGNADGTGAFRARAVLIPRTVRFRLPLLRRAPVIDGPQTAVVVAPKEAPPETIHTDEHGRCRVRFHWDRAGDTYDRASCWMRVSQLQTSGSMVLPRVDWEVVVEFLEGNPDRPVVTGRLFNDLFMPPYALPEGRTRTTMKSASTPSGGGTNEIRFEDKAGSEEVMIQSQYNTHVAAANNRKKKVGKDETIVVNNNAELVVGSNQKVQVTNGFESTVGGNQDVTVGGNRAVSVNAVYGLTVGGSATSTVGGNQMEMIGNPLEGLLSLAASKAVEAASKQVSEAIDKIEGAVQEAVNQALGPIADLQARVNALGPQMNAVSEGALASSVGLAAGVAALPGADDLSRSVAGGPAATRTGPEDSTSAAGISGAALVNAAVRGQLAQGVQAAKALGAAQAAGGSAGGSQSLANVGGPAGDLSGFSESDTAQGPGYSQYTVTGDTTETTGAMRVVAAAGEVMLNAKSETEDVGAAHIEVIKGSRAESVEGASSETEVALVMAVKGDVTQTVHGLLNVMVGGALMQTVGGTRSVTSGGNVNLVSATHSVDAKTKITLKCGASVVVIDGSGVMIQAPMVSIEGSKITLSKNVADA